MLRRRRVLPLLALSIALAACGGQSADASHAAGTLTRAFHALASGDGATLCSLATSAGQKTLAAAVPNSSCEKVVNLVSAHLTVKQKAALASVHVNKITVTGDRATVRAADISSDHGSFKGFLEPGSAPTKLAKQADGSWKISG